MARSAFSDDQFRERMWDGVLASGGMESRSADWQRFFARGHYCKGDLALPQDMARLKVMLEEAERGQSPSTGYFSFTVRKCHPKSGRVRTGPKRSTTRPSTRARSSSLRPRRRGRRTSYESLAKLGKLRDDGLVTEEEFEAQKRKLLERV